MDEAVRSAALFEQAKRVIPGGVSSPVRAFRSVGGTPRFIAHGRGPCLTDVDGRAYIDYVMSWGALPLGHAHPAVVRAVTEQVQRGSTFGAPTELETQLAERITSAMPAVEMVRFVSSGTEAAMSALRLARAATGRNRIVKFIGCYHGHADSVLVRAGSGVATLSLPDSPGVTPGSVADTLVAGFNDLPAVETLFEHYPDQIAAVIVEPVAGNMGLVMPAPDFLEGLRSLCGRHGALLVFDEVMTGFRVALGGAQGAFGIRPDLTCLGKVIGGGLPLAAYGGRADLMQMIAPAGPVYQAGTLSGNPLAVAAGIATLDELGRPGAFDHLAAISGALAEGVRASGRSASVPVQADAIGGMWGFFFAPDAVTDFDSAKRSDTALYARFFHAMLDSGVYLAPSQFEAAFVSMAHTEATTARTLDAIDQSLRTAKR